MAKKKIETVDQYIQGFPEDKQAKLREIRKYIKAVLPHAKEELKWGNPAYSDKIILVVFAGYKQHLNLNPTPSVIKALSKDLSNYKVGKGSVQFPYDKPLPAGLIKKLVALRLKEYQERGVKWM